MSRSPMARLETTFLSPHHFTLIEPLVVATGGDPMKKLFTIAAVMLFCACFAAAQTPGTAQPGSTTQPADTDQVLKPMLEFANANSAKIAWTSKQGADLDLHYSTDRNNLNQAGVGAVEKMGGDNHRAT